MSTAIVRQMESTADAIAKRFELEQRMAKAYITSNILPQRYKNIGDILILNEMSRSLNVPMVMLAQQLYVVKGTPQLSGQGAIALMNQSGKFDKPIMFEEREKPWGVRAYTYIDGEKIDGPWIDDALIQAEGWLSNPKWKTMKGQMARYRAAAWFARLYAPDVLMGMKVEGEVEDIEAEPIPAEPQNVNDINAALIQGASKKAEQPIQEAEPVPEEPKEQVQPAPVEEKPKRSRMPRYISKHYPRLEELGVQKKDLRDFAEHMDFTAMQEAEVEKFFTQTDAEIKRYINDYYGIEENEEPEFTEAEVEEQPEPAPEPEAAPAPAPDPKLAFARYRGMFVARGLNIDDVDAFIAWAGLTPENVREFFADDGAARALIEQFNEEAGYAGEEIPV
ncbi:hypothetical protein [Nitratifractor salsuginis]|uniref:Uncharacterized protein n=1 Tax=Nitratifractor salsuginis (strain DSM 16511 / JCM 12458 / E9I37-1) TaxID=749222 RepID=E6WYE3_NITSE|nr:hypothetical protein [Nitratifractor salsuginis]ADV46455.1 hypothetical protein Nitsa_1202 [Nitratifractor salsuginis DSM 16511]